MNKSSDTKPINPRSFDVGAFIASERFAEGRFLLAALGRLQEPAADDGATTDANTPGDPLQSQRDVVWSIRGHFQDKAAGEPNRWLRLTASAVVQRPCQRCMQPMPIPLNVDRSIRFVSTEAEAARLDAEEESDVLALESTHDLQALIEDELLLALPLIARHDDCRHPAWPGDASPDDADNEDATAPDHPFAALASLKAKRSG